jgi:hypothetical protein
MSFWDFFSTEPKIIPFGTPKKKGKPIYDIGSDLSKYMGDMDFGGDFLNYVQKTGKSAKASNVGDIGDFMKFIGSEMDVGGDYMKYIHESIVGRNEQEDFMSYIDTGTVKAFETKGKLSKKEKLNRFAPKELEGAYGLESVGIALSDTEESFGKANKQLYKKGQKLKEDIGHTRKIIKGDYEKLKEKVRKVRAKRRIEKGLIDMADTSEAGEGISSESTKSNEMQSLAYKYNKDRPIRSAPKATIARPRFTQDENPNAAP